MHGEMEDQAQRGRRPTHLDGAGAKVLGTREAVLKKRRWSAFHSTDKTVWQPRAIELKGVQKTILLREIPRSFVALLCGLKDDFVCCLSHSDVAVGTPVAQRPPRGSVRALISAHGSYRGYLASKRTMGYG